VQATGRREIPDRQVAAYSFWSVFFASRAPPLIGRNHTGARLNELFRRWLWLEAKELRSCEKEFFNAVGSAVVGLKLKASSHQ
jgi:hypothetical protein